MPGKPRRDVIYDRILARNPGLLFIQNEKLKLSAADTYDFSLSIIAGLLKRISLRNPEEEKAIWESLPRLEQRFAARVILHRSEAIDDVVRSLSKLSVPQLRRRIIDPSPLELAEHADRLSRTVPSKKDREKRRDWAKKHGIDRNDAAQSDSLLVEQVLAHKYGMSESKVHKILADASEFLR